MNLSTFATAGDWLRERRKALDLTQEALAERAGCSAQSIRKIEAGKQRPSQQLAVLLVAHLEVPAAERDDIVRRLRAAVHSTEPPDTSLPAIPKPASDAAPAARTPALPIPLTPLIGRAAEVRRVRELLLTVGARLVTLVGPPGIGKTRLALAAAQTLRDEFADGVYFVELAPLSDPDLVSSTIADTLGLARASGPLHERLSRYLRDKQVLLVLDNFEHLPAAAAGISLLLRETVGLKVLVTSRTPLRIYGEKQFPVPTLNVPDPQASMAPEQWLHYDAVRLFVERVRDVEPDFELTAQDAATVAEICARLDGLPLAIELAAARIRIFSLRALLAQLGDRLKLLRSGAADLPARQQTLSGAISWSYDLLSAVEQQLFRRMGVFAEGASLEAIAAVDGQGDAAVSLIDIVDSLVSKSLLRRQAGAAEPRFSMLETIKEYARQKLADSGEGEQMRLRHAEFYLRPGVVDAWWLPGDEYISWMERLAAEQENIRAALDWALTATSREQQQGLRLAWDAGANLGWYWFLRGRFIEARRWLPSLLQREALIAAQPGAQAEDLQRGKAGLLLARGATVHWHSPEARRLWEASLSLFRELGDRRNSALVLSYLARLVLARGDVAEAHGLVEEYLAISRELGDVAGISRALGLLSAVAYLQGDAEKARALTGALLAELRLLDSWLARATVVSDIATQLSIVREFVAAEPFWEEFHLVTQENNYIDGIANARCGLGLAAYGQGNFATARDHYLHGLAGQPIDVIGKKAYYVVQLAGVEMQLALLAQQDQAHVTGANQDVALAAGRAVALLGAGDELLSGELDLIESAIYEFVAASARKVLAGPEFDAAMARGRAMSEYEVYDYAAAPLETKGAPDPLALTMGPGQNTGVPPAYLGYPRSANPAIATG